MSYEAWLLEVDLFCIGLRVADKRPSWRLSTYSILPLPSTVSLPLPLPLSMARINLPFLYE